MYKGSKSHLDNLAAAREKAKEKTECCIHCEKYYAKSGIQSHERMCKRRKPCPVCGKLFAKYPSDEKITCSNKCKNTYFRMGENHPNWKEASYRTTCFLYHEKKCVVCGEQNIVEVHHLDEIKEHNEPENLIPLCPTHHQYWHSRFKHLVEPKIVEYLKRGIRYRKRRFLKT